MKYLYPKQVLYLYRDISRQLGSSIGIRDQGLLESAVYRPQATFGGQDLYPDLFSKTAALGHSLIRNHPFVDGNKRVGYAAMYFMLRINGYDLTPKEDAAFRFVLDVASGAASELAMAEWLKQHSRLRKADREK